MAEINDEDAFSFIEAHHRQGMATPGNRVSSYGIHHDGELLGVAIFCNPRTKGVQKKYTRELFRMAFKEGVRIRGGVSKLIKTYTNERSVVDIFTYQDTSGSAMDGYLAAGMKLVGKKNPKKEVLVKDGLTYGFATNNRRDWFSLQQVTTRGPDALLGTSLGEVFNDDGTRKTNVDLFLDHCGYHLEEIPGDRIYVWENPDVSFYLYKLTAPNNPGYYIGRKRVWGKATLESSRDDGYLGSGGKKFQYWVASVGEANIHKEILSIHQSWEGIIRAEKKAIGDLYRTDPNCKNKMPGGLGVAAAFATPKMLHCETHGDTAHRGTTCLRCMSLATMHLAVCPVHGEVKFQNEHCLTCIKMSSPYVSAECRVHGATMHRGGVCSSCATTTSLTTQVCLDHGETKFRHGKCVKCDWKELTVDGECPVHGEARFLNGLCLNCRTAQSFHTKTCEIHGETIFRGDVCSKCQAAPLYTLKDCPVHGEVSHRGDGCLTCIAEATLKQLECPIHGVTTHRGLSCMTCQSQKIVSVRECPEHGKVKFVGDKCRVCLNRSVVSLKDCSTHGSTKHQGNTCNKCASAKMIKLAICSTHGETKHRGDNCARCSAAKRVTEAACDVHGLAKFQSGKCTKCQSASLYSIRECEAHGLTKFKGKTCCKCTAAKTRHNRFHRDETKGNCYLCQPA